MRDERRGVAILGSTGSIGTTALRVLERQRDRFRVAALTAFNNAELLERAGDALLARRSSASCATAPSRIPGGASARNVSSKPRRATTSTSCSMPSSAPPDSTRRSPRSPAASASRSPTRRRSSWRAGSSASRCAEGGGEIIPVDSEHSAILQCITGPARGRGSARDHHRVGRTVSPVDAGAARARDARGCAAPSDVADGPQDHRRQRDARQQGARGDRSALPLRPAVRPHRGRRASAEHRAFVRRVRRRQRARAAGCAEHGTAGAVRADPSGPRRRQRGTSIRPGRVIAVDVRAAAG